MKNMFSKIGKIIKYEFKHSSRILLPLYGVLLGLGLLTGLSINGKKYEKVISDAINTNNGNFSVDIQLANQEAANGIVTGLLIFAVTVLTVAVTVVTIVTLARRFHTSMLGDEAYLNLSLPVTMGEQLWGRFIMDFIWLFCGGLVIMLAFMLCFIRMNLFGIIKEAIDSIPEINDFYAPQNITFGKFIFTQLLILFTASLWIISLIFVVNAISHLLKNQKAFVRVLLVVALIFICGKISNLVVPNFKPDSFQDFTNNWGKIYTNSAIILSIENLIWTAVYFGFTQFVFTKKLNLE